jgi:hypothetical protein
MRVDSVLRFFAIFAACMMSGLSGASGDMPIPSGQGGASAVLPLGGIAPISGLALIEQSDTRGTRYLTVHDSKYDPKSPKDLGKARVSVIDVQHGKNSGKTFRPVTIDWPNPEQGGRSNDLEGVCAVPDTGPEFRFLLLESSYFEGSHGRIFDVTLTYLGNEWKGHVNRTIMLPATPPDFPDGKDYPHNFEGITCVPGPDGQLIVVIGSHKIIKELRGTVVDKADLFFARISSVNKDADVTADQADWKELASIKAPGFRGEKDFRHCSDLYAESAGDGRFRLWASAAMDPNNDDGPFFSHIYLAGTIDPGKIEAGDEDQQTFFDPTNPERLGSWQFDGIKVEAIAAPPNTKSFRLSFATDDENYGGIWRPLGEPRGDSTPQSPDLESTQPAADITP